MYDDINPYESPTAEQDPKTISTPSGEEHPAFRDAGGMATFVLLLLTGIALLELGALLITVESEFFVDAAPNRAEFIGQASESLVLRGKIRIVTLLLGVVVIVPYFAWLHRVYANLPSLNAGELNSTPFRAIAGYLVPIINLFSPYQTMKEVWRHSDPAGVDPTMRPREHHVVKIWWGAWLFCMLLNFLTMDGGDSGPDMVEMPIFIRLSIFAAPLATTAAAIVLIRRITLSQRIRHAWLARVTSEGPAQESPLSAARLDSEQPGG